MYDSSLVNFCSVDVLSGLPGVAKLNIKEEHCGLTTCPSFLLYSAFIDVLRPLLPILP